MPYLRPHAGRIAAGVAAVAATLILATTPMAAAASSGGGGLTAAGTSSDSSGHKYPGDSKHLGDRILRQGMSGNDVRALQNLLSQAGFSVAVVGRFGPQTRASVIQFQRSRRLKADGVVTWAAVQSLNAAATAAQKLLNTPTAKARIVGGQAVPPAGAPDAIKAVIAAGNKIAFMPYIYGGGHGDWTDSGYDCSGSVSFALHGANLVSSPEDSTDLESYGSPGPGRWISIWADAAHTYMYVAGLRFDTSAQSQTGGSRWTYAGRSNSGFVERHPPRL